MGIYKIFPEKDATIYSLYPTKNAGLDEILEISTQLNNLQVGNNTSSLAEVSRTLIKFSNSDINSIVSVASASGNYKAYLKVYLANASQIPTDFTIYAHRVAYNWDMGTGKASNIPYTNDGVTWEDRVISGSWLTSSFIAGQTGSYGATAGGGVWYINPSASQSFTPYNPLDIEMDITSFVEMWYSSSVINNGLILKHSSSLEFNTSSIFNLSYFSRDTHTIYPPHLEIRWVDSSFTTGSGSLPIVSNNSIVLSLGNNPGKFKEGEVYKFNINVRDKYPARQFSTSSVYLNKKILPSSSYWSLKDLHTDETVIDFDSNYTVISSNESGSYFTVYMNGLEPERNYKFVFKTIIGNETLITDDNYYFKIVK